MFGVKVAVRRRVLLAACVAMAAMGAGGVAAPRAALAPRRPALAPKAAPGAPRPNILVILADDIGYSDLGCYGGEIATPNLDRLASEGLRFTQFYNMARCCPTRAGLLTGLDPHQAGVGHMTEDRGLPAYQGQLNDRCVTIAEVLKTTGYGTYAVGKWHVARNVTPRGPQIDWPNQRGFDRYYGIIGGAANYFAPGTLNRDNTRITAANDPEYKPEHYYFTDALTDNALRFLGDHRRDHPAQPFFMYAAYTAAHWPLMAPADEIAKYQGRYDAGYDPIRQARLAKQRKLGLLDPRWTPAPTVGKWDAVRDKAWEARCMEVYAAMVTRMDENIGRIVDDLRKNNQLDNTLIVFLQDNGACAEPMGRNDPAQRAKMPGTADTYVAYGENWANVSDTPFRLYKHWDHEGGVSTPLIAHWPARIAKNRDGSLVTDPGNITDIMATCVDIAGAAYPTSRANKPITPLPGISLLPALEGRPLRRAVPLFWEHEGNRAIRDGKWKLSYEHRRAVWELYDTDTDRAEMHDLSAQQPERVRAMSARWQTWADSVGVAPWPAGKLAKPAAAAAAVAKLDD